MGWGTDFKIDIYLNRKVFSNKYEVEDKISELEQSIENNKSLLKIYASSTPSDIIPEEYKDDPIGWINNEINLIFETIEEELLDCYRFRLYLEYLEENTIESKEKSDQESFFDVEDFKDNSGLPNYRYTPPPPDPAYWDGSIMGGLKNE